MPAFEMCQAIGRNCPQRTSAAARLYPDSGVRAIERGIVSAGCDPKTGDHRYPEPGLVRLTIPRRVYTQAHRDVTAEAVTAVYEDRHNAKELKRPYEDRLEYLRFSQARFELPPGCLRREHPQHGTQKRPAAGQAAGCFISPQQRFAEPPHRRSAISAVAKSICKPHSVPCIRKLASAG